VILWRDAHVSPALARWISDTFHVVTQAVRDLGLREANDLVIFHAAREAGAVRPLPLWYWCEIKPPRHRRYWCRWPPLRCRSCRCRGLAADRRRGQPCLHPGPAIRTGTPCLPDRRSQPLPLDATSRAWCAQGNSTVSHIMLLGAQAVAVLLPRGQGRRHSPATGVCQSGPHTLTSLSISVR
jgi:hypothetical protein